MAVEWLDPPSAATPPKAIAATAPRAAPVGGGIEWLDEPPPQDPRLAPATTNVQYGEGADPGDVPTVGQSEYAGTFSPNPTFPQGSRFNPAYDTATRTAAGNKDVPFFVNRLGELVDQTDGESALDTMGALAARFAAGQALPAPVVNAMFPSVRLEAAHSGMTSGLLGGLKNEVMGAGAGLGAMLRGGEYKPAYDEALTGLDERDRYLRTAYPLSYYGGGGAGAVAGAALTPEIKAGGAGVEALARMLPGQATVNAPRVAKAAQVAMDTGIGAGSAWGSADPGERDAAAMVGGGMALPLSVLTRGVLKGAPRTSSDPLPEVFAGARPRDLSRGAKYVKRQLGGTSPDELISLGQNPNMMAAEVMGPRAKTALGALARRSGETASELQGRVSARAIDRPQRIMDTFAEATGVSPEAAAGDIEALVNAGQKRVKPLFDAARANPQPIMSERLASIIETPAGKKALRQAVDDAANDIDGPGAQALGFEVTGMTPDGLPSGVTVRAPTLDTWDRIYKALQKTVDRDQFGRVIPDSQSPANYNINQVRKALRAELEGKSLEWKQAMAQSTDYMAARGAFERAQKMLFSNSTTAEKFSGLLRDMGDGERLAARAGVANAVFNLAQANRLRPGALKIPIVRAKLEALLGEDGANAISKMVNDEDAMRAFENRYAPGAGSITSEINLAAGEMDASPWLDAAVNAGIATAVAGPAGAKASLVRDAANAIGGYVRGGGAMSEGARNAAGRALMGSPQDLAALLANAPRESPRVARAMHGVAMGAPRLAGQLAAQRR